MTSAEFVGHFSPAQGPTNSALVIHYSSLANYAY